MKKLLLVDGSNLSFRMYFALESTQMTSPKGKPSWAIFGFLKILLDVFQKEKADACIAVFDTKEINFRKEKFTYYKANRPEQMPEDLALQWPEIIRALKLIGIKIVQKPGFEADDLIGTIACKAQESKKWQTQILTGDRDCLQLVSKDVQVLMPLRTGGYKAMNTEDVHLSLGVFPEQVIDLKSLSGDSSDNIKGVPGIGQKTAVKLIQEFGSLENTYRNLEKIKSASLTKKLSENKQLAFDSQFLARIKLDCDLDFAVNSEDLKISSEPKELSLFLEEYRLRNLQRKLPEIFPELENHFKNFKPDLLQEETSKKESLAIERKTVLEKEELKKIFFKLKSLEEFSLDLETSGLDTFSCSILGWAFAWKEKKTSKTISSVYVPVAHQYLGVPPQIDNSCVVEEFKNLLKENYQGKIIVQNAKYEYKILKRFGIDLSSSAIDVMLGSYVENPENYHGLKRQAARVFKYRMQLIEELVNSSSFSNSREKSKKKVIDLSKLEIDKVSDYACDDAALTLALFEFYTQKLSPELKTLWLELENPLVFLLAKMERKGVFLDRDKLLEISKDLNSKIKKLDSQIKEQLGILKINLNSTQQIGKALKEKGFTLKKTTSSGNLSTNSQILEELAKTDETGLIKKIIEFRILSKLQSTYTENLVNLIRPATQRIHCEFNQVFTSTGRLSSSNPNLQNIPIKNEKYGSLIRSAFVAEKENGVLISADYSQIELRVLAHYTEDPVLIEAFEKNQDIHARTASEIFEKKLEEVSLEQRRIGKTLNFALLYQQGTKATAKQLGISQQEAQEFTKRYFETFATIQDFMERILEKAREKGYVETIWGRRRYFKNLNSKIAVLKKAEERAAFNAPLQGSAADIMKIAMLEINKNLRKENLQAHLILQVHDEVLVETLHEEEEKVKSLIQKAMSRRDLFKLKVPLLAEISSGKSWKK